MIEIFSRSEPVTFVTQGTKKLVGLKLLFI